MNNINSTQKSSFWDWMPRKTTVLALGAFTVLATSVIGMTYICIPEPPRFSDNFYEPVDTNNSLINPDIGAIGELFLAGVGSLAVQAHTFKKEESTNNTSLLLNSSIPNYAIEEYALAQGLGGGLYDHLLKEVVPNNPHITNEVFNCLKDHIRKKLGNISSSTNKLELNSATNHKNLRYDAEIVAPHFIENVRKISKETGGDANFGPGDMFAIKGEDSLKRKIAGDSQSEKISIEQATQKISDALRGTIIIDSEEQMQSITKKTAEWVEAEGGSISWKNIFQEQRDDGYIGIHGKILLPFISDTGENRQIRCELQLHFRTVADGSLDSPKERMHLLYKNTNETPSPNDKLISKSVSKLSFLSGMASIGNICRSPEYLVDLCPNVRSHIR